MLVIEGLGDVTLNPLDPIPVHAAALGTYDRGGFQLSPELGVMDDDPARMAKKIESRRRDIEGEFKGALQEGKEREANLRYVKSLAPSEIPGAAAMGPTADIRMVKKSLAPVAPAQDDVAAVNVLIAKAEAECVACRERIAELTARRNRALEAEILAKEAGRKAEEGRKREADRLAFEAKRVLVTPVTVPAASVIQAKLMPAVPKEPGPPMTPFPVRTEIPGTPRVPVLALEAKKAAWFDAKAMVTPPDRRADCAAGNVNPDICREQGFPAPERKILKKGKKCVCEPEPTSLGFGFSGYTLEGLGEVESPSEAVKRCKKTHGVRNYIAVANCVDAAARSRLAAETGQEKGSGTPAFLTNVPGASPSPGAAASAPSTPSQADQDCEACKSGDRNPAFCSPECPPPGGPSPAASKGRQATPAEEASNQREVAELQRQEAARISDEAEKQRLLDEAEKRDALANKLDKGAGKKSSLVLPIAGGILGIAAIYLVSK